MADPDRSQANLGKFPLEQIWEGVQGGSIDLGDVDDFESLFWKLAVSPLHIGQLRERLYTLIDIIQDKSGAQLPLAETQELSDSTQEASQHEYEFLDSARQLFEYTQRFLSNTQDFLAALRAQAVGILEGIINYINTGSVPVGIACRLYSSPLSSFTPNVLAQPLAVTRHLQENSVIVAESLQIAFEWARRETVFAELPENIATAEVSKLVEVLMIIHRGLLVDADRVPSNYLQFFKANGWDTRYLVPFAQAVSDFFTVLNKIPYSKLWGLKTDLHCSVYGSLGTCVLQAGRDAERMSGAGVG